MRKLKVDIAAPQSEFGAASYLVHVLRLNTGLLFVIKVISNRSTGGLVDSGLFFRVLGGIQLRDRPKDVVLSTHSLCKGTEAELADPEAKAVSLTHSPDVVEVQLLDVLVHQAAQLGQVQLAVLLLHLALLGLQLLMAVL